MKVLLCHNYYQQRGGEDASFEAEAALLESRGHSVVRYTLHNDAVARMHPLTVAGKTMWNRSANRELRELIRVERPDVMHCTNTFPLLSTSAHDAARREGVPVVQALRNYRLVCPGAQLMRDGQICEDCLTSRFAWKGVQRGCYRGSKAGSLVVAAATAAQRASDAWFRRVDLFFTPSAFARTKLVEAGLPADRIAVKPNFLASDPGVGDGAGGYAVFVGRLSPEKGIDTMLAAWEQIGPRMPLKIVGDGPMAAQIHQAAATRPWLVPLGERPADEVLRIIGSAACLVMPSIWYETFGRTIMEAFAKATPAIVSDLGAMAELVDDGVNGLRFPAGDAAALATCVIRLHDDPSLRRKLRKGARSTFLDRFTADANYPMLLDLYRRATATAQASRRWRGARAQPVVGGVGA